MRLSVIIVNYNVRHFIEQCLCAVQKALGENGEIIVVDNASSDQSLEYLVPRFPRVRFIANPTNDGFAKACNMGWKASIGDYALFLNPDTIVPEDCFTKCLAFMDGHPDAGALGVKMLDGSGHFLRESKRSFPSPVTSFYKLVGLSALFPRSAVFSKYHLGALDENKNHVVDVLAGAFMLVRRDVLEKTGGFDEIFFMYGEDVDLSYRIQEAGYKNYYFAETDIIHFKGESTRKGSMNYVRMFYKAMSVFVKKHYGGSRAGIFNVFIQLAIWIRAGLTATAQFIRRIGLPLIDASMIFLSFWIVKNTWNQYVRTDTVYQNKLLLIAFPVYTVCYLVAAYYAGLYDRWYRKSGLIRSTLAATIILLAGYALLPEHLRFSRAIILFGALLAFILITLQRWIFTKMEVLNQMEEADEYASTMIAGNTEEYESVMKIMRSSGQQQRVLGRVAVDEKDETATGQWKNIDQLSATLPFRELICCEGQLSFSEIIRFTAAGPHRFNIKIHADGSDSVVGSHSKDSSGETLTNEAGFRIADPYYRRQKRLIDVLISLSGLVLFPVPLLLVKNPLRFWSHCFEVLIARKTWVGYAGNKSQLPSLKPGVLGSNGVPLPVKIQLPAESLNRIDYRYARDYEPVADLRLIRKSFRRLGGV
ncbi:MAG: glycosyltransferase [Chitinophagaceae bacterium]|nr:glycosyltransferase [Chitinophagaceae bacterium]